MKYMLVVLAIGAISIVATGFRIEYSPATKNNIVDIDWRTTKQGVLVWGQTLSRDRFLIDAYDSLLNQVASYTKVISNFTIAEACEVYSDDSIMEFIFLNDKRNRQAFLRLNHNLKELYFSGPIPLSKFSGRDSSSLVLDYYSDTGVIDNARIAKNYWEIVKTNKPSHENDSVSIVLRNLRLRGDVQMPTFDLVWQFSIPWARGEYFKLIYVDSSSVYLYANYSTASNEQYVYCLNNVDGSIRYKTKITAPGIAAFIYSNCFNDVQNNSLIIGGTYFSIDKNGLGNPGLGIVCLDSNGQITSFKTKEEFTFTYPPTGEFNGTTVGLPSRNSKTYNRFCEIDRLKTGELLSFIDAYSIIHVHNGTVKTLRDLDQNYHYLMTQTVLYKFENKRMVPFTNSASSAPHNWYNSGFDFHGIGHFESQITKPENVGYADNVNRLMDHEIGSNYYVGYEYEVRSGLIKCLMKNRFISQSGNVNLYFKSTTGKKNFVAFQKPEPIAGQDVLVQSQYLIRDLATLYKLTTTTKGYELSTQIW